LGVAAPQPGGPGGREPPEGAKNNIKHRFGAMEVTKPYEFIGFLSQLRKQASKSRWSVGGRPPDTPVLAGGFGERQRAGGRPGFKRRLWGEAAEIDIYGHKPYKFTGVEAIDVTKPNKFIGFGAIDVTEPYKCIGFVAIDVTFCVNYGGLKCAEVVST
jgi:hypothetical protein